MKKLIPPLLLIILFACKKNTPVESLPASYLENTFGGSEKDQFSSITILDDFIYLFGHSNSFSSNNDQDFYLVKTDLEGKLVWQKTYPVNGKDVATRIFPLIDGTFILIGSTYRKNADISQAYIAKINTNGTLIWEKVIDTNINSSLFDGFEDSDGNIFLTGIEEKANLKNNWLFIKLDKSGNILSQKTYGSPENDGGIRINQTPNNKILVFGFTERKASNNRDLVLLEINSDLDSVKSYEYGGSGYEEAQGMFIDNNGTLYLSGHSDKTDIKHNAITLNVKENGEIVWEKHFGGKAHDGSQDVLKNQAGNIVVLSRSMSFNGNRQVYLTTLSQDGNIVSERNFGSDQYEWGNQIIEYKSNYYIAGHIQPSMNGQSDAYFLKVRCN